MISISVLRRMRFRRSIFWAAAFAFVLNVTLTGLLLASISPANADPFSYFCLNGADPIEKSAGHDQTPKRTVPCTVCLNHVVGGFIAPEPPNLPTYSQVCATTNSIVSTTSYSNDVPRDCQPRGPPSLV
jgi:hypothetical protein